MKNYKVNLSGTSNAKQMDFFRDDESKLLHLSGGMGCIRSTTRIETEHGPIAIKDLKKGTRVWGVGDSGPVLAACGEPYVKGISRLYRVVHEAGEFVAHGRHLIALGDGSYQYVDDLSLGQSIFSCLPRSNSDVCPLGFQTNDGHLFQTSEDCLVDYQGSHHLCDRSLHLQKEAAPRRSPPPTDGQGSIQSVLIAGGSAPLPINTHPSGASCRRSNQDFVAQKVAIVEVGEDSPVVVSSEYISGEDQVLPRFHKRSECRPINLGFLDDRESLFPLTISNATILQINQLDHEEEYWDMEVPGPNNYVAEGCVHHNSGKSYMLVAKLIKLSQLNKDIRGGVVCPDYSEYRKDFRPALIEFLDMHRIKYHEHKSYNTWRFPWSKKEVQVVTAEKRIRGPNWGFAVINELTLIPLVRYQETIARVRIKGAPCPQIASSGTPEGFANDYYEYLIEKPKPNARVINVSTRENEKNLGADYIKMLENTFDSLQQAAYIDGEWVNMTTNRFYYKYDPKRHDDRTAEFHANEDHHGLFPETVHVSMDFNVNPMSANMWQQREIIPKLGLRRIVAFDEINIKGDADTERMCIAMKENGYTPDRCIVYADPAGRARSTQGAPDKKILEDHGYEVRCRMSHPRFRKRMLNAANLFEKDIVSINPDKCPELKKDLLNNSFASDTYEKDKSQPMRTHHSDGMDYMFDILYPFSGNRDGISSVKIR